MDQKTVTFLKLKNGKLLRIVKPEDSRPPANKSTDGTQKLYVWSNESSKKLLQFIKENSENFQNSKIPNKNLWKKIANELKCTEAQAENRFKYLKRTYRKANNLVVTTGIRRSACSFQYWNEMDDLIGNKSMVTPTLSFDEINYDDSSLEDDGEPRSKRRKCPCTVQLLKIQREQLELSKKMVDVMDRFVRTFEKLVDKQAE